MGRAAHLTIELTVPVDLDVVQLLPRATAAEIVGAKALLALREALAAGDANIFADALRALDPALVGPQLVEVRGDGD
jgi:hypothetical protein